MTDDTAIAELARLIYPDWHGHGVIPTEAITAARRIHAAGWRRPGSITDAQVEAAADAIGELIRTSRSWHLRCAMAALKAAADVVTARAVLEAAAKIDVSLSGKTAENVLEWLPIESAPRDGSNLLGCVAGVPRSAGEIFWGISNWTTWDGENHVRTVMYPTHWQPLPAPPKAS